MKYIVKNCPAFCDYTRQCRGAYDRKISHQYCSGNNDTDCLIKQIVGLCEEKIKVCEGCSKTADINIDCVECDERGEANISRAIINLLEIEEVDE